jgi:hypothetical protein
VNLRVTKPAPLYESGGAVELEIVSFQKVVFFMEVVVDGRVDGNEFCVCFVRIAVIKLQS